MDANTSILRSTYINHFPFEIKSAKIWSGRVSSDDNYRVYSHGTRSQHEHSFMNFNCPTRE